MKPWPGKLPQPVDFFPRTLFGPCMHCGCSWMLHSWELGDFDTAPLCDDCVSCPGYAEKGSVIQ